MDSQNTAEKSELKQDTLCDSIDLQIQSQMKFKGCVNIQNSRAWEWGEGAGERGVERGSGEPSGLMGLFRMSV